MATTKTGFQTIAIHGGEVPDKQTGASAPNIVMSSTFVVDEPVSFSVNNANEDTPYIYTRWANPTTSNLETKLALLENADQCLAFASGMAASSAILFSQLDQGDHLVISNTNYPGTAEIAREHLPRKGITVSPVDTSQLINIENAIRPETRIIWIETPSNPLLRITDISGAAAIAHANNAILVVDSTFASPIATRPLELGADLVVHSLTKYIGGHGDALGGAVLGNQQIIMKLRESGAMHYGATISPFNAWLIMRGAATLPLRMRAHQENAITVASFLADHPEVEHVLYPGHPSHPQHQLARSQMDNFSGMMAVKVKHPEETARRMMKDLEIIHYAVSLGHHRSLIYLMETRDLIASSYRLEGNELEKYRAVAGEGIFRLSIGLEDADDIITDLDRVLQT
jgi:methionine-gamma-lyase